MQQLNRPKVGDIIEIISTTNGCRGAEGKTAEVIDGRKYKEKSMHGMCKEDTRHMEMMYVRVIKEDAEYPDAIWRINADAVVKILSGIKNDYEIW